MYEREVAIKTLKKRIITIIYTTKQKLHFLKIIYLCYKSMVEPDPTGIPCGIQSDQNRQFLQPQLIYLSI